MNLTTIFGGPKPVAGEGGANYDVEFGVAMESMDAAIAAAIADVTVVPVTDATYTFLLTDRGKAVYGNRATAQTFTVPPNTSVPYPVGTQIGIAQIGVGIITLAPGAEVTLNPIGDLALTQYSMRVLHQYAANTWLLV